MSDFAFAMFIIFIAAFVSIVLYAEHRVGNICAKAGYSGNSTISGELYCTRHIDGSIDLKLYDEILKGDDK